MTTPSTTPTPQQEALRDKPMPLVEHLAELRRRLLYALGGVLVLFIVSFYFAKDIFNFLVQPFVDLQGDEARRLIFTAMHEQFFTEVKLAFFTAIFLGFPLLAGQAWKFAAPGLYRNEKRAFIPFLVLTPLLFFSGGAFVYYIVMPVAWEFFAGFEQTAAEGIAAIELEPKVNEYLSLVMRLMLAFGLCFELPILLLILLRAGLVTIAGLRRFRRYAIVCAFVAAAILTPPDPLSQLGLALPVILLYEFSILLGWLLQRRAEKRNNEAN